MTAPEARLASAAAEGMNPLLPTGSELLAWLAPALALALLIWAGAALLRAPTMPPTRRFLWLLVALLVPVIGAILVLLAVRATRRGAVESSPPHAAAQPRTATQHSAGGR